MVKTKINPFEILEMLMNPAKSTGPCLPAFSSLPLEFKHNLIQLVDAYTQNRDRKSIKESELLQISNLFTETLPLLKDDIIKQSSTSNDSQESFIQMLQIMKRLLGGNTMTEKRYAAACGLCHPSKPGYLLQEAAHLLQTSEPQIIELAIQIIG